MSASLSRAAHQSLVPKCHGCALAIWSNTTPCCDVLAFDSLRALVQGRLTGRSALSAFTVTDNNLNKLVASFVTAAAPLSPEVTRALAATNVAEMVATLGSTSGAIAILTHELEQHRRSHSAISRAFPAYCHPAEGLMRSYLITELMGIKSTIRSFPRCVAVSGDMTWDMVTRALSVKTRIPAWVTGALTDAAQVYMANNHPSVSRGPSQELLARISVRAFVPPFNAWLKTLTVVERARLFLVAHAEHRKNQIRVSWAPVCKASKPAVVCTRCGTLLSAHHGIPHHSVGPIIDARADKVRCGACQSDCVVTVPLEGRRITVANPQGAFVIGGCRACGVTHTLSTGVCMSCSELKPQTCICRRTSKTPTTPFVCSKNGRHVLRWACDKHFSLLPPTIEEESAIAKKLGIRM